MFKVPKLRIPDYVLAPQVRIPGYVRLPLLTLVIVLQIPDYVMSQNNAFQSVFYVTK